MSPKAIQLIKHYESLHDGDLKEVGIQPKLDPVGIWTIGWGHAIIDPLNGKFLRGKENYKRAKDLFPGFNIQQAEDLFLRDISVFQKEVSRLVGIRLNPDQLGALTSFCYNIGIGNFRKSSALKRIKLGDLKGCGDALLLWNKGTINGMKVVLKGLTYRRMSERDLLVKGELKFYNK